MFNKLQEAIALAEEAELMETAISDILSEENFDDQIDDYMNRDINILIREEKEMGLEPDEELDEILDDEEDDDVELEELLESVFEGF